MNSEIFIEKNNPEQFVLVSNCTARDEKLSLAARGLLVMLLSHANGYKLCKKSLMAKHNLSRDVLERLINELKFFGYLSFKPRHNALGHYAGQYWILNGISTDTEKTRADFEAAYPKRVRANRPNPFAKKPDSKYPPAETVSRDMGSTGMRKVPEHGACLKTGRPASHIEDNGFKKTNNIQNIHQNASAFGASARTELGESKTAPDLTNIPGQTETPGEETSRKPDSAPKRSSNFESDSEKNRVARLLLAYCRHVRSEAQRGALSPQMAIAVRSAASKLISAGRTESDLKQFIAWYDTTYAGQKRAPGQVFGFNLFTDNWAAFEAAASAQKPAIKTITTDHGQLNVIAESGCGDYYICHFDARQVAYVSKINLRVQGVRPRTGGINA